MDDNDGVRTRLTHSHEVANLARSIGTRVAKTVSSAFAGADLYETVQPILSSIGLAHDLGNPPFGHQGEVAIGRWFTERSGWIFTHEDDSAGVTLETPVPGHLRKEFEEFDGNPQSLRLLAQLQTSQGRVGLDLTAATLAASLKYPVNAQNQDKKRKDIKKHGYFESEAQIVTWIREQTGLIEKQRHPLTWIMEACDDIAYSVLDTDDLLKKDIISPDDVYVILSHNPYVGQAETVKKIASKFDEVDKGSRRADIRRDIKIGYVRAYLIESLIKEASKAYIDHLAPIFDGRHELPLMETSHLCSALKSIAQQYAFSHRSVLKTEAIGVAALDALMTAFWEAIRSREGPDDLLSRRVGAKARYVYSLISPNYLEAAEQAAANAGVSGSMRYRELRLLTDMISGMTDTFAIKLWEQLKAVPGVHSV